MYLLVILYTFIDNRVVSCPSNLKLHEYRKEQRNKNPHFVRSCSYIHNFVFLYIMIQDDPCFSFIKLLTCCRGRARGLSAMTSPASSAWPRATAPSTCPSGTSPTSSKQVRKCLSHFISCTIFAKSTCFVNELYSQIFLVQNVIILLHKPITNPLPIVSRSNTM